MKLFFSRAGVFYSIVIYHHVTCNPAITIFNAYPRRNLAALLTFGTKKYYKNTVDYGVFKNITLTSSDYDYIVQLIKPPQAGETYFTLRKHSLLMFSVLDPLPNFSSYGYLAGYDDETIQDALVILSPLKNEMQDTSILFEKITDDLSRIYFFNAMENLDNPNKGILSSGAFLCKYSEPLL